MLPLPSVEDVEEFVASLEEYVAHTVYAATPDLGNIPQAFNQLWTDLTRYGHPSLPSFPSLGTFEVPAPTRPPPPPPSFWRTLSHWADNHRFTVCAIGLGLAGSSFYIGLAAAQARSRQWLRKKSRITKQGERRQVVVVLGGDTNLGAPLVAGLEAAGYIVIASVSTPDAVKELETCCNGYVKALVLDPLEPASVPYFLRSLQSTMSLRFPLHAHGDPHTSPATHPYLHSVISLLTLATPSATLAPAPLEQLDMQSTYLPYLTATHVLPLQLIQSLLPLFRTAPRSPAGAKRAIVLCVPAAHSQVGVPFAAAQAMSAAATVRGANVLRRELRAASITSPSMLNLRVVIADVGLVGTPSSPPAYDEDATRDWTASEKVVYGEAVLSALHHNHRRSVRKPAETSVFVDAIVRAVSGGQKGSRGRVSLLPANLGAGLGQLGDWLRGDRFSVGAGALTYALASHLPRIVLDALLNLPHVLLSVRNALVPLGGHRPLQVDSLGSSSRNTAIHPTIDAGRLELVQEEARGDSLASLSDHDPDSSNHSSEEEADVESNAGEFGRSNVSNSWVSLHGTRNPSPT